MPDKCLLISSLLDRASRSLVEKRDSVLVSYIIEFYIREPVNRMNRVHLLQ